MTTRCWGYGKNDVDTKLIPTLLILNLYDHEVIETGSDVQAGPDVEEVAAFSGITFRRMRRSTTRTRWVQYRAGDARPNPRTVSALLQRGGLLVHCPVK